MARSHGCAGGVDANIRFPLERVAATEGEGFELQVKGLRGGPPGSTSIAAAQRNKLLVRLLKAAEPLGCALAISVAAPCATPSPRGPCQPAGAPPPAWLTSRPWWTATPGIYQSELAATEANLTVLLTAQGRNRPSSRASPCKAACWMPLMACPERGDAHERRHPGRDRDLHQPGCHQDTRGEVYGVQCLIRSSSIPVARTSSR